MDSLTAFRSLDPGHPEPEWLALSRSIGWTGAAIGLAELAAPGIVADVLGLDGGLPTRTALRGLGGIGVATGLAVAMRPGRAAPLWIRIAGDLFGLAAMAWLGRDAKPRRNGVAMMASAAAIALEVAATAKVTRSQEHRSAPVMSSVTINKPPHEVYAFFRDFERLPRFMRYLESVVETDATHSRWVAVTAVGQISWTAEITEDRPGERIAWETSNVVFAHRGVVTFARAPGGQATEVRVEMDLAVPGIAPSATLARVFTRPQIKADLRRLKQVLETGQVLLSDASVHLLPHPAQPSAAPRPEAPRPAARTELSGSEGGVR